MNYAWAKEFTCSLSHNILYNKKIGRTGGWEKRKETVKRKKNS